MHHLDQILIVLGCGCVLPIMVVWFMIRESINKTNKRTQIVLAAIEKNPDMDIEELMRKISPKKKLLKEKLLSKLLWGGIIAFLGIALLGYSAFSAQFYWASVLLSLSIIMLVRSCLPRRSMLRRSCWYHRQKTSDSRSFHHPGRA